VLNSDNFLRKVLLHQYAKPRLKNIYKNHKVLNGLGIAAVPINLDPNENFVSMPRYTESIL